MTVRPRAGRIGRRLMVLTAFALAATAGAAVPTAGQAGARSWCPEPESRQFDFWVGEWNVVNRNSAPGSDEWIDTGTATDRVYPVVGGCAIVEHWSGSAFRPPIRFDGFSIRAYDPAREVWDLVLYWPIQGPAAFANPTGVFRNGRGDFHNHFINPQGDTVRTRLSFSDIGAEHLQWNNAFSSGAAWDSTWIMRFSRRPLDADPLDNGPTAESGRCPGEPHRGLDHVLGRWEGVRTVRGESTPVRAHVARILDGCASMERIVAEDGTWEAFAVRALERTGEWVEWVVSADRPVLRSRAGRLDGDAVFQDHVGRHGLVTRERWLERDEDELVRVLERAGSSAGPWTMVAELRLRRAGNGT